MLHLPILKVSVWGSLSHLSSGDKIQGRRVHKGGTERSYLEKQPCCNVSPSLVKLLPIARYSAGTDLGTKDMPQEGQPGNCVLSASYSESKNDPFSIQLLF